jgi:hypothetical protein
MPGTSRLPRLPTGDELNDILRKALTAVATEAIAIIRARTTAGRDLDGNAFAPYSPTYAKAKAQSGNTVVNLTASGELLAGLKLLRIEPSGQAIIGWDSRQHATEHYTRQGLKKGNSTVALLDLIEGLQHKREFLGIRNPEELSRLVALCEREIAAGIQQLQH